MLKLFLRHYGCRNFSQSRLLKFAEKEKDVVKSSQTTEPARPAGVPHDFVPNEFEKTILVLSGRFKSKDLIPPRITYETMENARSRFRIRGSNVLMVLTLALCGYYVWKGKRRAKEGDTIAQRYWDLDKKLKADYEKEKSHQS